MSNKLAGTILFLSITALGTAAQERYLKPVDEAKKDPSFYAFRTGLIEAVKRRDAKYVVGIIDRNIRVSFGDNHGLADFNRIWKIENPKSDFWDEFLIVLNNGGRFYKERGRNAQTQFFAPYAYAAFPEDLDAFEHAAILGRDVNLRSTPDTNGELIAKLSYNLVKVDYNNSIRNGDDIETLTWVKVETFGSKKGFVKAEYVRSPVDYRAGFQKKNGKWKMTVFIAGD